jgi:hypothetical protein
MRKVKVTISYEWDIDEKEWKGLLDWDTNTVEAKVKDRLEFDPVSAFFSLSQIKFPEPGLVKVIKVSD